MSTVAIILLAVLALLAWLALLDAVKEALAIRAKASACPCRDLHSMTLTPGATYELPAGIELSAAPHPEFVASFSTKGTEAVRDAFEGCANRTKSSEEPEDDGPADLEAEINETVDKAPWEASDAYQDIRDAIGINRAKMMMASDNQLRRLQGELQLIKVLRRRAELGAPVMVD
ncbi:hypothetical protein MKK55_08665 [Methylobacterium sp. J-059]|uniref:hypothetical protein n=1 Tax=Methylobacterium sp. J-059 TaxID=2836643 RepID=UPI001FBA4A03|nr:hypothetical protein [Methylobacterium sp. J-059]MCJ2039025.1 hypothetical protein [Methylobacterium sp. J-059]